MKPNKQYIKEKALAGIDEIREILEDGRMDEAWKQCILLAAKHIGTKNARDILSDKKLNARYLDKIEEIITLTKNKDLYGAREKINKLYAEVTTEPYIHSAIVPLICKVKEMLDGQEDISLHDITGELATLR